jgi:hypothetical protein
MTREEILKAKALDFTHEDCDGVVLGVWGEMNFKDFLKNELGVSIPETKEDEGLFDKNLFTSGLVIRSSELPGTFGPMGMLKLDECYYCSSARKALKIVELLAEEKVSVENEDLKVKFDITFEGLKRRIFVLEYHDHGQNMIKQDVIRHQTVGDVLKQLSEEYYMNICSVLNTPEIEERAFDDFEKAINDARINKNIKSDKDVFELLVNRFVLLVNEE